LGGLVREPAGILFFTRSDLAGIEVTPREVIEAVRQGYLALANGSSRCPTKLMMPLPDADRDAVSYSMLG
jgi:ornithine cyclodeaminase